MKDLTQYDDQALNDYMICLERWIDDDEFDDDYNIISSLITDIRTELRDRKINEII